MKKVGVVYFTKTHVTGHLARALIDGLRESHQVSVLEHCIEGQEICEGRFQNQALLDDLVDCDAIVFGSPTYMGGASAQFKSFADATGDIWSRQLWAGKLAAGFTCGTAANGDQTGTLQYFVTLSSQHGMLWAGLDSAHGNNDAGINRLGCQLGVVAHSVDGQVHPADLATANYLGKRISALLLKT